MDADAKPIIAAPAMTPITVRLVNISVRMSLQNKTLTVWVYITETSCGWLSAKPARDIRTNSAFLCMAGMVWAPQ